MYMALMLLGRHIHTAVSESTAFDMEMAIEKLKSHKSPDIDQIPAEFIKTQVGHFAVRSINF